MCDSSSILGNSAGAKDKDRAVESPGQANQKRHRAILIPSDSSAKDEQTAQQKSKVNEFEVGVGDAEPGHQMDSMGKMTPQPTNKSKIATRSGAPPGHRDVMMDSATSMKKTPNSLQQKFVSGSAKQAQLRTVEDARMAPLDEQAQAGEEGLNSRLQLTPMISGAKPSREMGNEGNGGLAATDRPKRRTRNVKNSRYDGADYLVDYSGSGRSHYLMQPSKYKSRKVGDASGGDLASYSNCLTMTMNAAASTGEQSKQAPTEVSKKPNKRLAKQARKEKLQMLSKSNN